jgi:plastocyanin
MTKPHTWAAISICSAVVAGCALSAGSPSGPPTGAVTGSIRFLDRPSADTAIGPVVVMLEPLEPVSEPIRATQLFEVASSTDRFDPEFAAIARGDFLVFVNQGSVSHRFFSAQLGSEVQIPVAAAASSTPQRIDHTGEVRFYCALHPDETFGLLVTGDVFSTVASDDGGYYLGPLPDGSYRLSIWSPRVEGTIRDVEVAEGRSLVETIWIDPDLIVR